MAYTNSYSQLQQTHAVWCISHLTVYERTSTLEDQYIYENTYRYIKHQKAVHPHTAETKAQELSVNPLHRCREIRPWRTKMNSEFSAALIRKHHLTTCCCLFWVERCNYLSASPAVDYINQISSQLEAVQLESLGVGECEMCIGWLCSVQMPFSNPIFELLSAYSVLLQSNHVLNYELNHAVSSSWFVHTVLSHLDSL